MTDATVVTPRAAAQISRLMTRDGAHGLKIGVKKGGCAGMEYTMEMELLINELLSIIQVCKYVPIVEWNTSDQPIEVKSK